MSNPPTGPADLQAALQRFREEFAQQLPARLEQLRERFAACEAQPEDREALRELHRTVHQLAGSAGTFGMDALSDDARAIEDQLEPLLDAPLPVDLAPIAQALAALQDAGTA